MMNLMTKEEFYKYIENINLEEIQVREHLTSIGINRIIAHGIARGIIPDLKRWYEERDMKLISFDDFGSYITVYVD